MTFVLGIASARRRGEPIPAREFVGPVTVIALMGLGMLVVVLLLDGTAVIVAILAVAALGLLGFVWQARHAAGDGGSSV